MLCGCFLFSWNPHLSAHGFVWDIREDLFSGQIITFTERHMFASNAGPWILPQGNSYIEIIGDIKYL
jgi:hypothetical protein